MGVGLGFVVRMTDMIYAPPIYLDVRPKMLTVKRRVRRLDHVRECVYTLHLRRETHLQLPCLSS